MPAGSPDEAPKRVAIIEQPRSSPASLPLGATTER